MQAGFLQFDPVFADPAANLEKCRSYLLNVKADLMVLPELALSGYYFTSKEDLINAAGYIRDVCIPELAGIAALKDMAIVMGYPELAGGRLYNSSILLLPDRSGYNYRKMHLFGTEKAVFDQADSGFTVFEVKGVKVGLLVCYDHFFPEAARTLALQGVQLVCHPANLVLEGKAQRTTQVRALENRIFWILANRTGNETTDGKRVIFTGGSQICAPDGSLLLSAGKNDEGCGVVEFDPAEALNKHVTEVDDVLADRRPEFYKI